MFIIGVKSKEREITLGENMGNTINDSRFDFLSKMGFSTEIINKHTELWNESVLTSVLMKPFLELSVDNLKYMLEITHSENLTLYLFFLYNDAFLLEKDDFMCSIGVNLEKTFDRIFNPETDGVVALYGKGKNIILKQITK